ncbi:MAG: FKBP-type peptidyl-prolyl cis-trans isomerase [Bacteroidales bacterium]|jgi:FKBP-type peptidyl-prolyl cis-trans isomerase|nr:FKBP-type peptidyl-prolyl cis-trans isomerase [Bacteroidales bacterium]
MIIRSLIISLLSLVIFSCNSDQGKIIEKSGPGKKEMSDLNRYFVQKDRERIESYIGRKKLKMTESPTGLWYAILSEGNGDYFTDNDKVILEYEVALLDGTSCYSSKEHGPKEVIIGKSGMEAGLNQGLRMLKPGGEAIFIMPSFMAFGFTGDGNKIPARAVIVYNITNTQKN